jgi:hypothetical protein
MEQVAWNKSSLILNEQIQNTQTLDDLNRKYLQKLLTMPSRRIGFSAQVV